MSSDEPRNGLESRETSPITRIVAVAALVLWSLNGLIFGVLWAGSVLSIHSEKAQFGLAFLTPAFVVCLWGWLTTFRWLRGKRPHGVTILLVVPVTALLLPWAVVVASFALAIVLFG